MDSFLLEGMYLLSENIERSFISNEELTSTECILTQSCTPWALIRCPLESAGDSSSCRFWAGHFTDALCLFAAACHMKFDGRLKIESNWYCPITFKSCYFEKNEICFSSTESAVKFLFNLKLLTKSEDNLWKQLCRFFSWYL